MSPAAFQPVLFERQTMIDGSLPVNCGEGVELRVRNRNDRHMVKFVI